MIHIWSRMLDKLEFLAGVGTGFFLVGWYDWIFESLDGFVDLGET